jgi:hypothetical protein
MASGHPVGVRAMGQSRPSRTFWWDREPPAEADVLRAVIFDADSALADIERDGHRVAFNAAFAEHGVDVSWSVEEYGAGLRARGFGNSADALAGRIYRTKTTVFGDCVLDGDISPRSGLIDSVMSLFVAGIWVGVVSTQRRAWVETLVRQLIGDGLVETIVTVDDLPEAAARGVSCAPRSAPNCLRSSSPPATRPTSSSSPPRRFVPATTVLSRCWRPASSGRTDAGGFSSTPPERPNRPAAASR